MILRKIYTKPQERRPYQRKNIKCFLMCNALSNFQAVKKNAFKIRFDSNLMKIFTTFNDTTEKNEHNSESTNSFSKLRKKKGSIQSFSLQTFRDLKLPWAENEKKKLKKFNTSLTKNGENYLSAENFLEKFNLLNFPILKKKFVRSKESHHNLQNMIKEKKLELSSSDKSENEYSSAEKNFNNSLFKHEYEEDKKNENVQTNILRLRTKPDINPINVSEEDKSEDEKPTILKSDFSKERSIKCKCEKSENSTSLLRNKLTSLKTVNFTDLNYERDKNMFMYDFESLKIFSNYCKEDNYKNIVKKTVLARKSVLRSLKLTKLTRKSTSKTANKNKSKIFV